MQNGGKKNNAQKEGNKNSKLQKSAAQKKFIFLFTNFKSVRRPQKQVARSYQNLFSDTTKTF